MRQLERPAAVRHTRRDPEAGGTVAIAHEERDGRAARRRVGPEVVECDLQRPDAIPPISLDMVNVPGLGGPGVHQRVAPLTELAEERVSVPDDLTEKPSLVRVCYQLLDLDAFQHACRLLEV